MDLRAILFDLDGTLIDSLPGIEYAVDCALAKLDLPRRKSSLRPLIGPPIRQILAQILEDSVSDQDLSQLEATFRLVYDSAGWRKTILHSHAMQTLAALKNSGVRLYVVTNKPKIPTTRILEELGVLEYFSQVLSRDSRYPVFPSKAAMLRHLVTTENLATENCVYVGDTLEDFHAGDEIGIPVALVPYGYGEVDRDVLGPSCKVLTNLADLVNRVQISGDRL